MATLIEQPIKALQIIPGAALNPVLPTSALAYLTYGPPHLVARIANTDVIKRWIGILGLKTALKILAGLGIGRVLNRVQNLRAINNDIRFA
ncbi:hypothetical protein INS49_003288 [Diaporthe citri]|uniref:uncharacterized protein n=1 Tax=Diaporthe citri TaxID=83186 RepID=UPI001C7FC96A|nr:uncharacterized protein INS49_003288 [Diaporthe citri]KAG6355327.1 hypothetical protein INS49_003288 [Diaporthe citri]